MAKTSKKTVVAHWMVGMVLATAGSAALAAFNFGAATWANGATTNAAATTTDDKGLTVNGKAVSVIASAYSVGNGTVQNPSTTFSSGTTFTKAVLAGYGADGLGVKSGTDANSPDHAIDNKDRTDMVLLQFSAAVMLDYVTVGWNNNNGYDSDISVLRYTGTGTPVIAGQTWAQLTSSWQLVGNYLDLQEDAAQKIDKSSTSSWWLVSAFNTGFNQNGKGSSSDNGNDYFKLASLVASVPTNTPGTPVPEPGSLALMGGALVALLGLRRRFVR